MDEQKEGDALSEVNAGYLSIGEAASILGVSERSVYGYVGAGRLVGKRVTNGQMVVSAEEVHSLVRRAPGRVRVNAPRWHVPPVGNHIFITTLTVRAWPGQGALLDERLEQIRRTDSHRISGTVARYIGRNQADPDEIEMILVWRRAVMPVVEERESALSSLALDLADVLDWETAVMKEGQVLLHA